MSFFKNLLTTPAAWLAPGTDTEGLVVSSRVRLARNIANIPFPARGGDKGCRQVWEKLEPILYRIPGLDGGLATEITALMDLEKQILFERHLISRELMERGPGGGVAISADETLVAMVNEEDHLRLQAMRPGLDLTGTWEAVNTLDNLLERKVEYAFSPRLGYLTACPTNVGTGIRASVMLHLPALVLKNELEPITRGLAKIGHTVRGLWGEGTETAGHLFQISNQITLGQTEKTIIEHLEQIVREIMDHERNARAMLKKMKVPLLKDFVNRAQALVKHAQLFTTRDALNQLSGLRLGAAMGISRNVDVATLDHLMLLTQPAHLQWALGRAIDVPERDVVRARFIKEHMRRHAAQHIRNTHEDKAT